MPCLSPVCPKQVDLHPSSKNQYAKHPSVHPNRGPKQPFDSLNSSETSLKPVVLSTRSIPRKCTRKSSYGIQKSPSSSATCLSVFLIRLCSSHAMSSSENFPFHSDDPQGFRSAFEKNLEWDEMEWASHQHPALSTQHPAPSTQHPALSTRAQFTIEWNGVTSAPTMSLTRFAFERYELSRKLRTSKME